MHIHLGSFVYLCYQQLVVKKWIGIHFSLAFFGVFLLIRSTHSKILVPFKATLHSTLSYNWLNQTKTKFAFAGIMGIEHAGDLHNYTTCDFVISVAAADK